MNRKSQSNLNFKQKIVNFQNFLGPEVWNLFILATALGVFWFLVESGFVLILQSFLMSLGLIEKSKTMLPSWFPTEIWATTLILIAFGVTRGLALAARYYFAVATGQSFITHQRSQILEIGLNNASSMSTHEILIAYTDHTNTASTALQQISQLINNFVSLTLFVIAGFYLTPKEFFLSVIFLSAALLPIIYLNRKIQNIGITINSSRESANKTMIDGLKNNFFLQIYHLINKQIALGKSSLNLFEKSYKKYARIAGLRNAIPQIIGATVIALVTFISLKYFHTPGSKLLAFFYIFIRMAQCASDFYSVTGDLKIQMIGLKILYGWTLKLNEWKNIPQENELKIPSSELENLHVEINNLNFSYSDKQIISNLNIEVNPNTVLLIRGESGAGKSTLLSLILGLIQPTSGSIKINSYSPHLIRTNLAEKIGYVGPEPYLIGGTVKENLLYGHPHPDTVLNIQLWQALEKAQLKFEIESLPDKLEENLLEKTQLSTGQKQRLAIARALVRNPSLLILDEATANLDPETEAKFIELLPNLTKEMTTIIVTHKDSFNYIATQQITLYKKR
jgi:ABC-type multidrug transport system fused ATPase/permease subunit